MKSNYIMIKADYDTEGGIENAVVTKVVYTGEGALDQTKEVIFKGNIKNLSSSDDNNEIKEALRLRFNAEGFEIKYSLS